eukprot:COSAG05_NODE_688_length_7906_cov_24.548098_7_plen_134_part_00
MPCACVRVVHLVVVIVRMAIHVIPAVVAALDLLRRTLYLFRTTRPSSAAVAAAVAAFGAAAVDSCGQTWVRVVCMGRSILRRAGTPCSIRAWRCNVPREAARLASRLAAAAPRILPVTRLKHRWQSSASSFSL